ncbi:DUF7256 domain-containing protein [Roseospira marina]|nr:hypothetical protein [Roseospira marina]MBB4314167.1 hypothetical protein [Roseospira marina]MBB5087328.1 hypothetical protein [Roseospira marina]
MTTKTMACVRRLTRRDVLHTTALGLGLMAMDGSFVMDGTNAPDPEALAALRPGMPISRVAEAMGSAWRAPPDHTGGVIDGLEHSHGVVVRLDQDDVIASIEFGWRFTKAAVDGFRIGMTLADVQALDPDVTVGDDLPRMRGVREGRRRLPTGVEMRLRFTRESLRSIRFTDHSATSRDPTAPPYPEPAGEPGAPFADPNFKLVVLSSLLREKELDLGTPEMLATHVLGRPVDLEDEGYDLIPEVLEYLRRYPLTDTLLAKVRSLYFDGGENIYVYPWYFWDGESYEFEVSSLQGIEHCPNVTDIDAIAMIDEIDIRQLTSLPHLESLSISTDFVGLDALLELPSLKTFRLIDTDTYKEAITPGHPTRSLLESLKSQGVSVAVRPGTWGGGRQPVFR